MDQPVGLCSVLCKEHQVRWSKAPRMHQGRMSLMDFTFAHGRKQSSLAVRVPKALIQSSYRLGRDEEVFKAFCFRIFIELAQSGLITALKSSYVITRSDVLCQCVCAHTYV